jgi:hypothetical protein
MPRGRDFGDEARAKSIASRRANALKRKAQKEALEAARLAREAKRQEAIRDHAVMPLNKTPAKMRTAVYEPPTLDENPPPLLCWNCGVEATQLVSWGPGLPVTPSCSGPTVDCNLPTPSWKRSESMRMCSPLAPMRTAKRYWYSVRHPARMLTGTSIQIPKTTGKTNSVCVWNFCKNKSNAIRA